MVSRNLGHQERPRNQSSMRVFSKTWKLPPKSQSGSLPSLLKPRTNRKSRRAKSKSPQWKRSNQKNTMSVASSKRSSNRLTNWKKKSSRRKMPKWFSSSNRNSKASVRRSLRSRSWNLWRKPTRRVTSSSSIRSTLRRPIRRPMRVIKTRKSRHRILPISIVWERLQPIKSSCQLTVKFRSTSRTSTRIWGTKLTCSSTRLKLRRPGSIQL